MNDKINHPEHYTSLDGIECIQVTEHFNFCRGNAIKYIWRSGLKTRTTEIEDLRKAQWYIKRELARLTEGTQPKLKVYVASPYSIGDKDVNTYNSLEAGDTIYAMGCIPVLPLLYHFWNEVSPRREDQWKEMGIYLLSDCDALVRLPGPSQGSDVEVAWALAHGLPVYYGIDAFIRSFDYDG
jgi:hypothetical protein